MSQIEPSDIPHRLDLVIDFVNTRDLDRDSDALQAPNELSRWLAERGLLPNGSRVSAEKHAHAIELREALRALMLANNHGEQAPDAWQTVDDAAGGGKLGVRFDRDGSVRLRAGAAGLAGALAQLLAPVAASVEDGSWRRVKACSAGDCLWAFYDRSRNRSAVWCEMAVCGNRTKVRAFRRRAAR